MKKITLLLFVTVLLFTLAACQEECPECEEYAVCEECTTCEVCTVCEDCVENPQLSFYEEMYFEGSGYTPAYDYYLSGTLNTDGEITDIRIDMISAVGNSKRSRAYDMNVAKFEIGGTSGNQTLKLFIGGSTEHIAQVYNTISGTVTADGSETFKSLGFQLSYPGQVISNEGEIYALLADALNITIDDTTTVAAVLTAAGLYDTTGSLVKNGSTYIELTGYYGGKNYNNQMTALEEYIVAQALTLEEAYDLVSTNNQGYDNRDAVAGATVLFDAKIVAIFAQAANIEINDDPIIIGEIMDGTDTILSVQVKGMYTMVVSVTIDSTGTVTSVTVPSHTETDGIGAAVITGTYLADLVTNQSDLTQLDAVAGATLTSNALKLAVQTALDAFNE